MQTGSSGTVIGCKSGQTNFVPLSPYLTYERTVVVVGGDVRGDIKVLFMLTLYSFTELW
jgi:hypothetical protein